MTGMELRELREEMRLTQDELADHLGVEVEEVKGWEDSPYTSVLGPLSTMFDLAMDELKSRAWFESDEMKQRFEEIERVCGKAAMP
jgi:transcriptional regulator with XRE-family HTH domain